MDNIEFSQEIKRQEDTPVNDTFTIHLLHVGMIRDLITRKLAKNKSQAVRDALEYYYASKENNNATTAGR